MKRTRTIAVLTALAMAAASLPGCVTLRTADADPAGQTEIGTAAGEDQRAESLTQTLASVLPSDALSGAEVEGDQVQVDLLSGGDGRSTLEDTRAIQAVYESIRACGFGDTVQTVRIRVFDRNRALLFEQTGHRSEEESRTEDAGNVTEEEIAAQVSGWLEAVPYRTESLSVSPPLPGGTLEIGLRAESVSDIRFDEIDALLENVQAYADRNRSLCACSVGVTVGEECALYAVRDFDFGCLTAWISPAYEETFIGQEGPR